MNDPNAEDPNVNSGCATATPTEIELARIGQQLREIHLELRAGSAHDPLAERPPTLDQEVDPEPISERMPEPTHLGAVVIDGTDEVVRVGDTSIDYPWATYGCRYAWKELSNPRPSPPLSALRHGRQRTVERIAGIIEDWTSAQMSERMPEPDYLGAVVMTLGVMFLRTETDSAWPWQSMEDGDDRRSWPGLVHPRPLTPTERRDRGMPQVAGPGQVVVRHADLEQAMGWLDESGSMTFGPEAFRVVTRLTAALSTLEGGGPVSDYKVVCTADTEAYASAYNQGHEDAVTQGLADDPSLASDWLAEREQMAASKALREAADWLDSFESPSSRESAYDQAGRGIIRLIRERARKMEADQ